MNDQFYEDVANGLIMPDGTPTPEALEAEAVCRDYWAGREENYLRFNSLC